MVVSFSTIYLLLSPTSRSAPVSRAPPTRKGLCSRRRPRRPSWFLPLDPGAPPETSWRSPLPPGTAQALQDEFHELMVLLYAGVAGQGRAFAFGAYRLLQLHGLLVLRVVEAEHRP